MAEMRVVLSPQGVSAAIRRSSLNIMQYFSLLLLPSLFIDMSRLNFSSLVKDLSRPSCSFYLFFIFGFRTMSCGVFGCLLKLQRLSDGNLGMFPSTSLGVPWLPPRDSHHLSVQLLPTARSYSNISSALYSCI
ncbi:hypothetical protein BJ165DRAFT_1466028 [Panaeolus papilionaceus]|nr:hypothetical protein BJ165DRAFT_1466028 [Panaeolus papilionaceus]